MKQVDVLILGQGLAGTLLGWACEWAGISFTLVDRGHDTASTMSAAGIINPVTGRRLVRSWRHAALLPLARETYQRIEAELGRRLWFEMRLRRLFADEQERRIARERQARGELDDVIEAADEYGWWIRGAARVDLQALLAGTRERWQREGKLRSGVAGVEDTRSEAAMTIDCRGAAATDDARFRFVPWEYSKGEVLELTVTDLEPDVILNRRHWLVPTAPGRALLGATHEPGVRDVQPSVGARNSLVHAAAGLLPPQHGFGVVGHRAGIRVNLPDRRPVVGRHPGELQLGIVNGLGAKGALWAPWLARQWIANLAVGAAFDVEVDVQRFAVPAGPASASG